VNEQKYEMIKALNLKLEYFSKNREDGWLEIIRKHEREDRMKLEKTISITATGWVNTSSYEAPDKRNYIVPYSLHSNFIELH
jgi:acylphosphatase